MVLSAAKASPLTPFSIMLRWLFLALFIGLSSSVSAYTISQLNDASYNSSADPGQSFTATSSGNLTVLKVKLSHNFPITVQFFSGGNGNAGTLLHQQALSYTYNTTTWVTLNLSSPIAVNTGQQYSFVLSTTGGPNIGNSGIAGGSVYAGGDLIVGGSSLITTADAAFEVTIEPPSVIDVTSTTANGSYGVGENIDITVQFSHTMTVSGVPQLTLDTGATDAVVYYSGGSGSDTLTFTYTIGSGENSSDLEYSSTTSLDKKSGSIKNGTVDADLTLPTPGTTGSLGDNKALVVDTTAPTLAQVTAVPSPTSDTTPDYTFSSNEAGAVSYAGDCSSTTNSASVGNNTITFNSLAAGTHNNCTITVTDSVGNASSALNVNAFNIDTAAPTLAQVTAVPNPTNDTTPSYTFSSNEAGTINYAGDCSSGTTAAIIGNNTVTFNLLSVGPHNNCTITVTDSVGHTSSTLNINAFTIDTAAPTLAQVTAVPSPTNDSTPDYTFSSNEAGSISYTGDCSSATTAATIGNNSITFNPLASGTHNNCTITVTDNAGNASSALNINAFSIDSAAPTLAQVRAVPSPTEDTSPDYTFSSTEAGTINYSGDCSSNTTTAIIGNNTVTFNSLTPGSHNNCSITVTDSVGNISSPLIVNTFNIDTNAQPVSIQSASSGTVSVTASVTSQSISQLSITEQINESSSGIVFPLGVVSFQVSSTIGGNVVVSLSFNQSLPEKGFFVYKIDSEGKRTPIPDSLWQQIDSHSINLSLTDGGPYDLDGIANWVIVDPIAIGTASDETLQAFTFKALDNQTYQQWTTSNIVTIKGLQQTATINVDGGFISLDGGDFTEGPVDVALGQTLQLMLETADGPSQMQVATVTLNDYQTTFKVKTTDSNHLNELFSYDHACSKDAIDELLKAYLSYYNRPADVAGLNYWSCEISALNGTLYSILPGFINTSELSLRFAGFENGEIIDEIYQTLLGRSPDTAGRNYWLEQLNNGELPLENIAIAILNAALGMDDALINNKLELVRYFYEQYGKNALNVSDYADVLSLVDEQSESLTQAMAMVDSRINRLIRLKNTLLNKRETCCIE